jgi:hypothetical protein
MFEKKLKVYIHPDMFVEYCLRWQEAMVIGGDV